jgi:hypothetical protein
VPERSFEKKTKFATNKERIEYEVSKINDPDPFEDPVIEEKIFNVMKNMGINIFYGFHI